MIRRSVVAVGWALFVALFGCSDGTVSGTARAPEAGDVGDVRDPGDAGVGPEAPGSDGGAGHGDAGEVGTDAGYCRGADCGGCVEAASVEQGGIAFGFAAPALTGRWANGDLWVVGPVTVTTITPPSEVDGERIRHGWEVNPAHGDGQGFDDRAGGGDRSRVPALPYEAQPGQSLVKAVSLRPTEADPRPSLERAAVLTVVGEPPPECGRVVFRPPYVGDDKATYYIDRIRTDRLPGYAPVAETPSLEAIRARFAPLQLDHEGGRTNRYLHPSEHMPNYGVDIGRDIGDGALRLMLEDALDEKLPALIAFLQMGIDLYHAALTGQTWPEGGGHQTGRKLAIAFAAVLLDDPGMKELVRTAGFFEEDTGVYYSETAGVPLYGYVYFHTNEESYWNRLVRDAGNKAHRDPYGWIDGGWIDGGNYQAIVSPTWKGEALAIHMMPALREVWDDPVFLGYVDRWVSLGFWTQPDPCAPEGSSWSGYGVTYGPDGSGGCIRGAGRFPATHATGADGPNRRSAFQGHLWDHYRGPSCYDGACEAGETAVGCPFDCGP